MIKKLIVIFVFFSLTGCGGGGSDSGGGVDSGTPGSTPYTGVYNGKATMAVSGDQLGAANQTFDYQVVVESNGRVLYGSPSQTQAGANAGTSCVFRESTTFVNGEVANFPIQRTCFVPGVGNCTLNGSGRMTFTDPSVVGKTEGTGECGGSKFNFRIEFGARR